jgi:uncharacterized protein YdaU (DUF1376 family)
MVAWFKHDIPAWMDGTEALDAEPYRAYHVICQLIYLNEGPIALNEHGIAGRCKQSIRTFRAALRTLIDLGKLTLLDGRLANSRAEKELENVSENRVNASKGGKKSAEVRNSHNKSLINNNQSQASLQEDRSLKTREDETREEKKDTSLRSVDDWPQDFREVFWKDYPRKAGKAQAIRKLETIRKSGNVTFVTLMAGVHRYATACLQIETQFQKHPATWLNAGCWDDEASALKRSTGPPRVNGPQGFESLFQQPERPPDEIAPRSEYDLDLAANTGH